MGWTVRGLNSGRSKRFFSHQNVQTGSGSNLPSYSIGKVGSSRLQSGRAWDWPWPLSSVDFKNEWGYITTSQYAFWVWTGTTSIFHFSLWRIRKCLLFISLNFDIYFSSLTGISKPKNRFRTNTARGSHAEPHAVARLRSITRKQ